MANDATEPTLEEFENAVFVRAQEPLETPGADSITITAEDFYGTGDPGDIRVLVFWRVMVKDGQQPTATTVWEQMTGEGMRDWDGAPVRLESVQAAVDRLTASGALARGGEAL